MVIGHYATALIPYSRYPKSSLLLLLIASNLSDLLWLAFAVFGFEPTKPANIMDVSLKNLDVVMTYSHDVIPTIIWAILMGVIAYGVSRSRPVALWCSGLVVLHVLCDLAIGYEHNLMGPDSLSMGSGMYRTNPELGLVIEAIFSGLCVAVFVWMQKRSGRPLSVKRIVVLYVIFIGGALAWIPAASQPLSELVAWGGCQCHPGQSFAAVVSSAGLALCVWPVVEDPKSK